MVPEKALKRTVFQRGLDMIKRRMGAGGSWDGCYIGRDCGVGGSGINEGE